jgi:glycosyltransferase involved in cell wall biosynthesis
MRVAYITSYNSEEVKHWSGSGYYIAEALKSQGIELLRINCNANYSFLLRLKRKLFKLLFRKVLLLEREPSYLKMLAKKANQLLLNKEYDIIFSPGSLPISYLKTNKPIVFFTDATYDCLINLYLKDQSLSKNTIENGNKAEALALQKATLAFYTSDWAIESAITKYNADKTKVRKTNFGPNLLNGFSERQIRVLITERFQRKVKDLLFIGVEWYRKGAKKAIETVALLNERGYQLSLTLVGCKIPEGETLPSFVKYYPFVSKDTADGRQLLDSLFQKASFFILPSEADCTPIVFSEAASYGLPVITTNTGGCPSVVLNNITGYCFHPTNFKEDASTVIAELMTDSQLYEKISLNAYYRFCSDLNWNVIGKQLIESIKPLMEKS